MAHHSPNQFYTYVWLNAQLFIVTITHISLLLVTYNNSNRLTMLVLGILNIIRIISRKSGLILKSFWTRI